VSVCVHITVESVCLQSQHRVSMSMQSQYVNVESIWAQLRPTYWALHHTKRALHHTKRALHIEPYILSPTYWLDSPCRESIYDQYDSTYAALHKPVGHSDCRFAYGLIYMYIYIYTDIYIYIHIHSSRLYSIYKYMSHIYQSQSRTSYQKSPTYWLYTQCSVSMRTYHCKVSSQLLCQ